MKIKALVKLALSVVMLALVLRFVELRNLKQVIGSISWMTATIVVVGYSAGQLLSSFKWWTIARAGGVEVSYPTALKAYFIGMFVNCFGFGTVGGDVARALLLDDGKSSKATTLSSVLADRLHGLAVLACIGILAIAYWGRHSLEPSLVYALYSLPVLVVIGWFTAPSLAFHLFPADTKLGRFVRHVFQAFPRQPKTVLLITIVSTVFHLTQIALHGVIAAGLGAPLPTSILLTTVPFVNILTSLPISWNGLGLRENAYRFFFVPALMTNEQALALGAVWLLGLVVSSSIGGIISVLTRDIEVIKEAEDVNVTA